MALNRDEVAVAKLSKEVERIARDLLGKEVAHINWYNDRTARGSVLRVLRVAIELAPTEGPV